MDDEWDDSGLVPTDLILNSAAGLAEFDPLSGTVPLIHFSVKQILEADHPEVLSQRHATVSKICLTYMSSPEFHSDHALAYDQIADWLLQRPFLGYCAENWGLHARAAPESAVLSSILKTLKTDGISSTAFIILYAVKWEMIDSCPNDASICHLAAFLGLSETLRAMLDAGTQADVYDECLRTPLYLAASCGHVESTKLLLNSKAKVTDRYKPERRDHYWQMSEKWWLPPWARSDKVGQAVKAAAESGHLQVMKMLCEAGANRNCSSGVHGSPLEAAVFNGRIEVVEWLLQRTTVGEKALNTAMYNSNAEMLEMLVSKVDHDAKTQKATEYSFRDADPGHFVDALYAAALLNRTSCAEVLLRHGDSANGYTSGIYRTPIQAAASQNHFEMLLPFVEAGADINDLSMEYISTLDRFAHFRLFTAESKRKVLRRTVSKCKDVVSQEIRMLTGNPELKKPSTFAVSRLEPDDPENLQGYEIKEKDVRFYEVQNRIAPSLSRRTQNMPRIGTSSWYSMMGDPDKHGSALQVAAFAGHIETVDELLKLGAEVNLFGGCYGTVLQAAAAGGHLSVVHQLVEHGACLTTLTGFYGNPLTAAAARGHLGVVKYLLSRGANPKARGGEYEYALSAAARNGSMDICHILLSADADVNTYGGVYGYAIQAACIGIPWSSFEERATTFAQEEWEARRTSRELEYFFQSVRDGNIFSNVRTEAMYKTMLQRAVGGPFQNAQAMFIAVNSCGLGDAQARVNDLLLHASEHYGQQLEVLETLLDR
jgi:ankyrin repeat protein